MPPYSCGGGLRSRAAACGRNRRGGAGAAAATASSGRSRKPPLAQRSEYASIIPDAPHIQGTARGTPSKYASGRRPAPHIWATATRGSAPIFTRALRRPPGKLAKRKRNAVCFLQAGAVPRRKNRAPQPGLGSNIPPGERQSLCHPIRREASRFGRSCPRAAGPAGRRPSPSPGAKKNPRP